MVRMNNTINILKEGSFTDVNPAVVKIAKDILEPYGETDDRELQQKYGDHLAEIGWSCALDQFPSSADGYWIRNATWLVGHICGSKSITELLQWQLKNGEGLGPQRFVEDNVA